MTLTISREKQDHAFLAADHLLSLQENDGSWEGEMVWCTMILSQYVIVQHLAGREWEPHAREQIIRHYEATLTSDGAWGLHPESAGYVFTTTLAYVALRLLGVSADDDMVASARRWLHAEPGGVLAIPTWGKFWLALLGLYGYEGVNPCVPELFAAPTWLPFHPRKFYCHTRYIYLGIAYLYGSRYIGDLGPLRDQLRRELFAQPFEAIDFAAHRHAIAASDVHVRPSFLLRQAYNLLAFFDCHHPRRWRRRALDHCFDRILYEQEVSDYQGLSPVNGLLNCLAILARDPEHPALAKSLAGLESWKWEDDIEGIRYAGARSQGWDTALAMQALLTAPQLSAPGCAAVRAGYRYLARVQITSELPAGKREGRDPALGGWCFSDGQHRWPVSDCTAEALLAILETHAHPSFSPLPPGEGSGVRVLERLPEERLRQAVEFILSRQNDDGGFGTYERRRGGALLERLNPSEMYGSCMTERSYLECTSSAIKALAAYRRTTCQRGPATPLYGKIDASIRHAVAFLLRQQRRDGAWPGFWGVNFTYAIFHAVEALRAAGLPADDKRLRRAADWLIDTQHADGGWGEHYSGCLHDCFVDRPESQVVQTSWALLALMQLLPTNTASLRRGIDWLRAQQKNDGSWQQVGVTGVFFGTAMLDYRLYSAYFPAWALTRYHARSS